MNNKVSDSNSHSQHQNRQDSQMLIQEPLIISSQSKNEIIELNPQQNQSIQNFNSNQILHDQIQDANQKTELQVNNDMFDFYFACNHQFLANSQGNPVQVQSRKKNSKQRLVSTASFNNQSSQKQGSSQMINNSKLSMVEEENSENQIQTHQNSESCQILSQPQSADTLAIQICLTAKPNQKIVISLNVKNISPLNDLICLLHKSFYQFNNLIDNYAKSDVEETQKVRLELDKNQLKDPQHFFALMDEALDFILNSFDNLIYSELLIPILGNQQGLKLDSVIKNFQNVQELNQSSNQLLIELKRFELFLKRINAHLLFHEEDLINFKFPEDFLIWKIYFFFYIGLKSDGQEHQIDFTQFFFTEFMGILQTYFEHLNEQLIAHNPQGKLHYQFQVALKNQFEKNNISETF